METEKYERTLEELRLNLTYQCTFKEIEEIIHSGEYDKLHNEILC